MGEGGKQGGEFFAEQGGDLLLTLTFIWRTEFSKQLTHLLSFEMDPLDQVIGAAALDGAPFDDVIGRSAQWIAHVRLLEDFLLARASAAIGQELLPGEGGPSGAVDHLDQAMVDGISHRHSAVDVPGKAGASPAVTWLWR